MNVDTLTTRRDFLRAYATCAVQARKNGNRADWLIAGREWRKLATPTEQRKPPVAIAKPWPTPITASRTT